MDIFIAVGFTILILIHEIGHIIAFKKLGLKLTNFYFVPLLGAFVSTDEFPKDHNKIAYLKYMGPLIGTVGVLACFVWFLYTKDVRFLLLFTMGAYLNLINLIPITFLDGQGVLKGVHNNIEWLGCIILVTVGFFILKDYTFTLLLLLIFTLFQDGPIEGEGFRVHELVLSLIYIIGMITATLFEQEYIIINTLYIFIAVYFLYLYLKSTVWSKEVYVPKERTEITPLTKRQKYGWSIAWVLLSTTLGLILFYGYQF